MKRRIGSFFYKKNTSKAEIARRRWHWPTIIGTIIKRTCMVLGGVVLFSIVMGLIGGLLLGGEKFKTLPAHMVLTLDMDEPVGETSHGRNWRDPLSGAGMTVEDFTRLFEESSRDSRVEGIVVKLDDAGMELAHIQELRQAVKDFRKSGKFAYLYTPSFGDLGSGIGAYYFAAAFDKIWMQPVGTVAISGIAIEMPFARKVLDKVGAKPEFLHREEYKSAMENLTNTEMSPANREMTSAILNDFSGFIFNDLLEDRKLKAQALQDQIDIGLISDADALKAGLIDKIDYYDVLIDTIEKKDSNGKAPETVDAYDYAAAMDQHDVSLHAANVALIHIDGEIIPGSDAEPGYATGDYIADAIRDAADQDNIRAIVVRVNSPGGSPSASETIRRAIVYAKEQKKKVYVSMGPLAASGGYWLTVDADRIFALPTTLTGSIGVIMGKFEISQTWEKAGVNWDFLSWGKNARLWSMNAPLDAHGLATLNAAIDSTYDAFMDRVSKGRNIQKAKVRTIAKGRAWTGMAATKNGLVDDIGGLNDVLDYTAKNIGVAGRQKLKIVVLPEPLSAFEELMQLAGGQVSIGTLDLKGMSFLKPYLRQADVMERIGPVQVYDSSLLSIRP